MISNPESRIAAIIPALNEAKTIYAVVKKVCLYATPIVVNDGSTDITSSQALEAGAIVVSHQENKGYEAALESGFKEALKLNYKYIITLDADGQHDPGIISEFHEKLKKGFDVVLGVRDKQQRLAEVVFSLISRVFWNINDPLCGMKGYSSSSLKLCYFKRDFDSIGTKYAIFCVKRKLKFTQIKLSTKSRIDKPRFGSGLKANLKIIKAMFNVAFV